MNTALLLLEFQNDYFPSGRTPLEKSTDACVQAQKVLDASREKNLLIIHLQHISTQPTASSLLPCTQGANFHPNLKPRSNELIIRKHYANAFRNNSLLKQLRQNLINNLIVCGMGIHATIDATVRAAFDLNFQCTIIEDACTAHGIEFQNQVIPPPQVHSAFLSVLAQQCDANILNAQTYIQLLDQTEIAVT